METYDLINVASHVSNGNTDCVLFLLKRMPVRFLFSGMSNREYKKLDRRSAAAQF
jgi:hypothetical protein